MLDSMSLEPRSFFFGFLACLAIGLLAYGTLSALAPAQTILLDSSADNVQPLFSPGSGDEIIGMIRGAQHDIDLEMYVFTDPALAKELTDAAARGVRVRVILESRVTASNLDAIAAALRAGGVEVRWASTTYQLTHAKMMVVDGKVVLVGSINFSKAAQNKNREAAAIVSGPDVAAYARVFETDWGMASAVRGGNASAANETG